MAAIDWAGKMRLGHSPPEEAWTALHTNIGAKLYIYSFREGPVNSLGAGVLSLFNYIGTSRIACLVDQIWKSTDIGTMFKYNISNLVLDAGQLGMLWDMNIDTITKYVGTHSWLYATVKYNYDNSIQLFIKHEGLKPKRRNDRAIMMCAAELYNNTSDLRSIKRARTMYNVVSLADISLVNGSGLDRRFLKEQKNRIHINSFGWETKHHVSLKDIKRWNIFLKWAYPIGTYELTNSLSYWDKSIEWIEDWDWFIK